MKIRSRHLAVLFLVAALTGCTKEDMTQGVDRTPKQIISSSRLIQEQISVFNRSAGIRFNTVNAYKRLPVYVNTEEEFFNNLLDLHLEVLPMYVFEGNSQSGDYYAVRGYVVSHNADCYSERTLETHSMDGDMVSMYGWYMSDLGLEFQLLSPDGNPLGPDDVGFYVTPEPSTTIGSTTYLKGFAFSLSPKISIGGVRIPAEDKDPSWKTIALGCVSLGFKWDDSSTQNLPDQSVEMTTDPQNRTVNYHFKTNNIREDFSSNAIPVLFRTDQRVDFSFVWHVKEGVLCSKDYDFGAMKMKVILNPKYAADITGTVTVTSEEDDYIQIKRLKSDCSSQEFSIDLPSMNRIPTGNIFFKNTTRSYATNIKIYREGEFETADEPYCIVNTNLDKNDYTSTIIREGVYDYIYELKNGDTGESKGLFAVRNVRVQKGEETQISTMDGKRVN